VSIAAISEARKLKLPPREKSVLMALADYADDDGDAYPKQKTLADWTGWSRATVNAALAWLEANDYIRSKQTYRDDGGQSFKRYHLSFLERMDELPLTESAEAQRVRKNQRKKS
jgi:DNA-binding MarR family transcriptional regulator